jgi:hypothetical protein
VGVNLSLPQLVWAGPRVVPKGFNAVRLVVADSCSPLGEDAFDLVLAVESILLFPSCSPAAPASSVR